MTSRRHSLALVASHAAVAAIGVFSTIAIFPQVPPQVDDEYFNSVVKDAVGVVARAKSRNREEVRAQYRISRFELADQFCIGFDRIAETLDGSNPTVCYPKTSPNAGPMLHEYDTAIPVSEIGRQPQR